MRKLILLLLIGGGAMMSLPERGASADSLVHATLQWWADALGPRVKPVMDPLLVWSARAELRSLQRDLIKRQESFQPLPHPSRFTDYILQHHLSGRGGLDPWGNEYFLEITLDSVILGSPGPDGIRNTQEDIRIGWMRQPAQAGTRSTWRLPIR